jgi:peptide/nickel transport system permease protein
MGAGDIYVTASFMLVLAATLLVGNIISDLLLGVLDPRIRVGGSAA